MNEMNKKEWIEYLYNAVASFRFSVDEETAKFNKRFKPEYHLTPKMYLELQNIPDFCLETFKLMLDAQHKSNNKIKE